MTECNNKRIAGVSGKENNIIRDILKDYPYDFYYYGSRVKGDYTKSSDLDILIKSNDKIPEKTLNELARRFNESLIPYVVNFSEYTMLAPNFYKLIEPSLVKVI